MKISEVHKNIKQPISFEIFPPKGDLDIDSFRSTLDGLVDLSPAFISVTCSAGGSGNSDKTVTLATIIKDEYAINSVAHLTCINSTRDEVLSAIAELKTRGIENVLALRGDIIPGKLASDFRHASELIPLLRGEGFCVGAACYPEGHVRCESMEKDIEYLKIKQDAGAEFFISQLFFDNSSFYRFLEKARASGINRPISPGVMPFLGESQITRTIFMCGASVPAEIVRILYKYKENPDDLKKAGIEYGAKQLDDLLKHGVDGVHIYTMNHPEIAKYQVEYINAHN